jgi:hypothetical protein
MQKRGTLNENLLALLISALAVSLAYFDNARSGVLESVIYAFLGYLVGKRLHGTKDS